MVLPKVYKFYKKQGLISKDCQYVHLTEDKDKALAVSVLWQT